MTHSLSPKTHRKNRIATCFFVCTLLLSLALVFMNVNYDAAYQIALGYRLVQGDQLLTQMWEPHQTSAFLCAIILQLYLFCTGSTTGIVIFVQFIGLVIRFILACFVYRAVKRTGHAIPAFWGMLLYILLAPQEVLVPEFGNMQHYFGTLILLFLEEYRIHQKQPYLILAAVSLCLQIFSYPSTILVYFAVLWILYRQSTHFTRDILLFTGVCLVIGGTFLCLLLQRIPPDTMQHILTAALAIEPSHTSQNTSVLLSYGKDLLHIFSTLGGIAVIVLCLERVLFFWRKKRHTHTAACRNAIRLLAGWYVMMVLFLQNILHASQRVWYTYPLLVIISGGLVCAKFLKKQEQPLYYAALSIGLTSFTATLLLSDQPLLPAVAYLLTFVCICLLPIWRWLETRQTEKSKLLWKCGWYLFFALLLFRCIFLHLPLYGRSQLMTLCDEYALVRSGPAMGLLTDEEGAVRQRDSMAEWKQSIRPGDKIWILGDPVDTLGYLYEDTQVAAPSVMSTPTYNEALSYYFTLNPDKLPDVLILSAYEGELIPQLSENEWLMQWIAQEYRPRKVIQGTFWNYYFREDR